MDEEASGMTSFEKMDDAYDNQFVKHRDFRTMCLRSVYFTIRMVATSETSGRLRDTLADGKIQKVASIQY